VALGGSLRIRERATASWRMGRAVAVKANADHEIDATGAFILNVYIDPGSALGAAVVQDLRSTITIVSNVEAARWRHALGDRKTVDSGRVKRWLTKLTWNSTREPSDLRVERVLRMLRQHPLHTRTTSLVHLSGVAGLSPSRFAHVFRESMGVPLRPYLRWLRLQRAARELVLGRSITQAAHVAGFADAAHLTRTFRRTLGATPRDLIRRAPGVLNVR
jgi:AraC-like DNA-binding protein